MVAPAILLENRGEEQVLGEEEEFNLEQVEIS